MLHLAEQQFDGLMGHKLQRLVNSAQWYGAMQGVGGVIKPYDGHLFRNADALFKQSPHESDGDVV